jgi:DNA-binding NtrC family response regulator
MQRILIIDDEAHMRRIVTANLAPAGCEITDAESVSEGRKQILTDDFDVVFVDQFLPDGQGLDIVACAREADPTLSVVMLTAMATVELAVAAMRGGAFDFLAKPFEPDVLLSVARRAGEHTALLRDNYRLKREVGLHEAGTRISGTSDAIRAVRATIAKVAPTNATVLITGETGTGKELVARAIHDISLRASKPFVPVNCAAFSEPLLESELFGHEKGAFTGADRSRQGLFEAATEGTLFLDEIGELSLTAQAKLLRVLTDGKIMRVGSTQLRKVNVRVLVATHRDLVAMVKEGGFRQDLYYRLAVVPLAVPPLRQRTEDIPVLCEGLSQQIARELKAPHRHITAEALARLRSYAFPGNVRELRNIIERAYILSPGETLNADNLASSMGITTIAGPQLGAGMCANCEMPNYLPEGCELPKLLEDMEYTILRNALASAGGVQAEAARRVGLSRSMFSYKLAKYANRG